MFRVPVASSIVTNRNNFGVKVVKTGVLSAKVVPRLTAEEIFLDVKPIDHPHHGLLPNRLQVVEAPFSPISPVNRIVGPSFAWIMYQLRHLRFEKCPNSRQQAWPKRGCGMLLDSWQQ
jgi:hypothetical protein